MGVGGVLKLGEHAVKPRPEAAQLHPTQHKGNGELCQVHHFLPDVQAAPFEHRGGGGDCGAGWGLGPRHGQRRPQQLTPLRLVGHTVGAEQRQSLPELQGVAFYDAQEGVLGGVGEGA